MNKLRILDFSKVKLAEKFINNNKVRCEELYHLYQAGHLVPCVGSGITSSYIGTWNQLIDILLRERYIDHTFSLGCEDGYWDFFQNVTIGNSKLSPLELGEYLLLDSKDHSEQFENPKNQKVWRELYLGAQIQRSMPVIEDAKQKFLHCSNINDTLFALLASCIHATKNHCGFQHMITYNYDTLLEEFLNNSVCKNHVINVSFPSVNAIHNLKINSLNSYNNSYPNINISRNMVNIYHVHGCLTLEGQPNPVVFSESSYDLLSNQIYSWGNQIQSELYLRNSFLYVGFSGADPNFRRLLKQFHQSNNHTGLKSYLFMNYTNLYEQIHLPEIVPERKNEALFIQKALDVLLDMVDHYYYEKYHIQILWYSCFDDIGKIINALRKVPHHSKSYGGSATGC